MPREICTEIQSALYKTMRATWQTSYPGLGVGPQDETAGMPGMQEAGVMRQKKTNQL